MSIKKFSVIALSIALVGCANHGAKNARTGYGEGAEGAYTQGAGEGSSYGANDQYGHSEGDHIAARTYYFGYDRFDLQSQDIAAIEAHASYLTSHPEKSVIVEGHTDERGSSEYNIALGERRAKAVSRVLMAHGVSPQQISVVSYGAERPAVRGAGEHSWAQNRRAIIVYR